MISSRFKKEEICNIPELKLTASLSLICSILPLGYTCRQQYKIISV